MTEREQIEQLQQNRHLIAGGVYRGATVEQVAGWIQTTCELAMRWIDAPKVMATKGVPYMITLRDGNQVESVEQYLPPPNIESTRRREVAAAPLPADMPRVEIIEDDGETA